MPGKLKRAVLKESKKPIHKSQRRTPPPAAADQNKPTTLQLIPGLPNDIGRKIGGYLPAYSFQGLQGITRINRQWHEAFKKKTIEEVVASCNCAQDALNILSDVQYYDKLTIVQLFKIAAHHPDLLSLIENNLLIRDESDELDALLSTSPTFAIKLLKDVSTEFFRLYLRFGGINKEVAEAIYKDKEIRRKYPKLLSDLARASESVTRELFKNDALNYTDGFKLISKHKIFVLELLQKESELPTPQFVGAQLKTLCEHHVEAAIFVVTNKKLSKLLDHNHLLALGSLYPEVAKFILEKDELKNKLSPAELEKLSYTQKENIFKLLEKQKCPLRITELVEICAIDEDTTIKLLEHESHQGKLTANLLAFLVRKHRKAAMVILKNPILLNKYLKKYRLLDLSSSHEQTAEYILHEKTLRENLNSGQTFEIIQRYPKLMHYTLSSPDSCQLRPNHLSCTNRWVPAKNVPLLLSRPPSYEIGLDFQVRLERITYVAQTLHEAAKALKQKEALSFSKPNA